MKIYTKTGDKGYTSNYLDERLPKNHSLFNVLGDLDELNTHFGLIGSLFIDTKFEKRMYKRLMITDIHNTKDEELIFTYNNISTIQSLLMDISSHLATPRSSDKLTIRKKKKTELNERIVIMLEKWIDRLDEILPPLKNFILPNGSQLVCNIHICRTIARRVERGLYELESDSYGDVVNRFMNRLSDYLFMLARFVGYIKYEQEIIYKPFSDPIIQ